ncbi:MAG: NTP transferase domain-containing protein [Gemmataceae bacterium]
MQIVIPMAGLGQRFADAGYTLPKPLIPIDGVPMVVRVVQALPPAKRVVFVVHPEHHAKFPLQQILTQAVPQAKIVVAPGLTAGQACSVRLAAPELDPTDAVLVAACDNTQVADLNAHAELIADPTVQATVWGFRGDPRVLIKPTAYGWIRHLHTRVTCISVKVPISETPLADAAISGTFWFRTAQLMNDGIDALVAANRRVNNEFYLDSVPGLLVEQGTAVALFELQKYIGWGTPEDLHDYLRWQSHFFHSPLRSAA